MEGYNYHHYICNIGIIMFWLNIYVMFRGIVTEFQVGSNLKYNYKQFVYPYLKR